MTLKYIYQSPPFVCSVFVFCCFPSFSQFPQFLLFFFFCFSLSLSLSLSLVCVLLPMWCCCKIKLVWCFFLLLNFCCYCFCFFFSTNFCDSFLWWVWEESWPCFRCCCCCRCVWGCVFRFGCASVSSLMLYLYAKIYVVCVSEYVSKEVMKTMMVLWWWRWWFCDEDDDGSSV